jgi:hypothetical protein
VYACGFAVLHPETAMCTRGSFTFRAFVSRSWGALAPLCLVLTVAACGDDEEAKTPDSSDTAIPDTGTPDGIDTVQVDTISPDVVDTTSPEVSPDPGSGLCVGLITTCTDQCSDATCFDACLTTEADSVAEKDLATTYLACIDLGDCERPADADQAEVRASYLCEQTACNSQRRACEQGATSGLGDCGPIGGCLDNCLPEDFTCQRGCFLVATTEAARLFVDLQYCVAANCYVTGGSSADYQTCAQFALAELGPCVLYRDACFADSSGVLGIVFRPVSGKLPPNPW